MNLNLSGSSNLAVGERVNGCLFCGLWKPGDWSIVKAALTQTALMLLFNVTRIPTFLSSTRSTLLLCRWTRIFFFFAWNNPSIQTVVYPQWQFYHRSPVKFVMCGHLNAKCWNRSSLNQFFTSPCESYESARRCSEMSVALRRHHRKPYVLSIWGSMRQWVQQHPGHS